MRIYFFRSDPINAINDPLEIVYRVPSQLFLVHNIRLMFKAKPDDDDDFKIKFQQERLDTLDFYTPYFGGQNHFFIVPFLLPQISPKLLF